MGGAKSFYFPPSRLPSSPNLLPTFVHSSSFFSAFFFLKIGASIEAGLKFKNLLP